MKKLLIIGLLLSGVTAQAGNVRTYTQAAVTDLTAMGCTDVRYVNAAAAFSLTGSSGDPNMASTETAGNYVHPSGRGHIKIGQYVWSQLKDWLIWL